MHPTALTTHRAPGTRVDVVWAPDGTAETDVTVLVDPLARVDQLLATLAGTPPPAGVGLDVDGAFHPPSRRLAEVAIRRGAVLRPATGPAPAAATATVEVTVVGGLRAGARTGLVPGRHIVGRHPSCAVVLGDPTVSARHAELHVAGDGTVTITDLATTNGTRVDGQFVVDRATVLPAGAVVTLGATQLVVAPPADPPRAALTAPGPKATLVFNRAPRHPGPQPPEPVRVPAPPAPPQPRSPLSWAALVTPLLFGAGMALVIDPRFAAFALFGPVVLLATHLEERRRGKKTARGNQRRLAEQVQDACRQVGEAAGVEARRRRVLHPGPAEAARLAQTRAACLWERRADAPDFMQLRVGLGAVAWSPPVVSDAPAGGQPDPQLQAVLASAALLDAPAVADLRPGRVVGVAGDAVASAALLRSLVVQAAVLHGPADLRVAVLTSPGRVADWDWVKWLPHAAGEAGPMVAADGEAHAALVEGLLRGGRQLTLLVDDAAVAAGAGGAALRALLAGEGAAVAALVAAPAVERLPARCTTIVALCDADGTAEVRQAGAGGGHRVLAAGVDVAAARRTATVLAGLHDGDGSDAAADLPERVTLLELLDLPEVTADAVTARWAAGLGLSAVLGVSTHGPLAVDLVADGPHGLIAGTTGAGKSELLRTLVAGLALTASPDDVTFVLIDYKGGSAFDACARLPHTVGVVTDLDGNLAERALRCLEAELRHRERLLRDAGAGDLDEYRRRAGTPLPRLLIVVDEFATLVAELGDFVRRLVGVAQRGRSLGVHLLLATQRPSGAVDDHIRANTNLRIALRVQDPGDSADVIGTDAAAALDRRVPGRAYVRFGPGEILPLQTAITGAPADAGDEPPVTPFGVGAPAAPAPAAPGGSDLERLVEAAAAAWAATGRPAPRRPWVEPLPDAIDLATLEPLPEPDPPAAPRAVIGLADDPDRQRTQPYLFDAARGNLLVYGVPGSGTTTTLATVALALAQASTPERLHLYAVDYGAGGLAALAGLPHVGAVVRAGERERTERLVRLLTAELARRRDEPGADRPAVVVLVDGWAGLAGALDDLPGARVLAALERVVADGPALGIWTVASADRPTAIPTAVAALVGERLLLRLAERADYTGFGVFGAELPAVAGRGLDASSGLHVQVARPGPTLAGAVARVAAGVPAGPRPPAVGVLPAAVRLADVAEAATATPESLFLPLGIGDAQLQPAGLLLRAGDHALVTGPSRSGKSTVLAAVATVARMLDVVVSAVSLRESPLRDCPGIAQLATRPEQVADLLAAAVASPGRQLLLVDDADDVDDPDGELARLLAARRPDLHVVAAGRADVLRSTYGHWTAALRRSRLGLALKPNLDLDGELWHTALPRHSSVRIDAGRGYLVADGTAELLAVGR